MKELKMKEGTKWTLDPCHDRQGYSTVRCSDGSITGNTSCQPIATVYDESNARLIAAAPEMLEALKIADISDGFMATASMNQLRLRLHTIQQSAKQAIDKAIGTPHERIANIMGQAAKEIRSPLNDDELDACEQANEKGLR